MATSDTSTTINAAALDRCAEALATAPPGLVAEVRRLQVDSARPPWQDTGIDLAPGQALTWFTCGATRVPAVPGLSVPARFQLWARVGAGEVERGTRGHHSLSAARGGRLALGSYFPGEWTTREGGLAVPPEAYAQVEGLLEVLLIAWAPGVSPASGLAALQGLADGGLAALERARLAHPGAPPPDWRYLWYLGPSETFSAARHEQHVCIDCATREDAAILQHDAPLPFLPETRLRWQWRVDTLPSAVAEDSLPTHDYLSIAVEFDNGQDLTYMWSAALPAGTVFRCPLPHWDQRETHVVVRSGTRELGQWLAEERDVYADYQAALGTPPARVLRVWLIAVSLFQKQAGACSYRAISLANAAGEVRVA